MAGIFGFLDFSERGETSRANKILLDAAQLGFGHPHATHFFEHSLVGCATPLHYSDTRWPLVSTDASTALAIFGEVYLPDGSPLRTANYERGFLRPFLESRYELLSKLNGSFSLAFMSADECVLVNDAFGTFPLHYCSTDAQFAFSTQMLPLQRLAATEGLDERGLFEHLAISQSLSGRTLLRGVQRLPRGTILSVSRGGIQSAAHVQRTFHASPHVVKALDEVYESLSVAIERSTKYPSVTAALSGGFDSRMTWSILLSLGHGQDVVANTHGLPNARDMALALQIANDLHLRSDRIELSRTDLDRFPNDWQHFVAITEGQYPLSQIFAHHAMRDLGRRFRVLIDSYGGVLYRRQIKKSVEHRIDLQRDLAVQVLPYELTPLAKSALLKPHALEEMYRVAINGLQEYYGGIENVPDIGDKFDLYYADQTAALRDSFSASHQMNFIGVLQPLMDRHAIRAVSRLPGALRRREGIHNYVIHRADPRLERFPLDYSGYPAPYRGFSKLRMLGPAIDRALRIAALPFPFLRGVTIRRPAMDAKSVLKPGLTLAREILLSSHPTFDSIVNRAALERELDLMEEGYFDSGTAIIQLLTFRLFLDLFA